MNTTHESAAKVLAPEDVRIGTYVAVLDVVQEMIVGTAVESWSSNPPEVVRVRTMPCDCEFCGHVTPMRVIAVCLPYVFVRKPGPGKGECRTIDIRRYRLAELAQDYGRAAFKTLSRQLTEKAAKTA